MISKNHVKHIQSLHSKKHREEELLFIVEGTKVVLEFINSNKYQIVEVLATSPFISKHLDLLEKRAWHILK